MREVKWENRTLSELGNVSRGKSKHRPRNDSSLYGGDYPFIQTGDVKEANFYINDYSQTYNEKGLKQSKLWGKDTLCITIAANIAETAILSFPACFPDSIVGFIPFENVSDVRYMKYTLDNYKNEFQGKSKGATQDNLSVSKIDSQKLLVPEYNYQVEIATIISTYDELIENNQKRIKTLEEMAQRLYTEWFVNFKFPGHEDVKMVDSGNEFGMIPEGWEVKRLEDVVQIIRGKSYSSSEMDTNDGIYYLVNLKNFNRGGGFRLDGGKYFNGTVNNDQLLRSGDLVVAVTDMTRERAVISRPAIIPKINHLKITMSADVVKVKNNVLSNVYLFYLLMEDRFTETTKAKANGANVLHLKPSAIAEHTFILPSLGIINTFTEIVEKYIRLIDELNIQNSRSLEIRELLIENLVTGKRFLK